MKRFLISNPSLTNNQFARITSSGELTIVNTGVDDAWVTTEKQNDFCLAPRQSLPVGEKSVVEGLSLDGTFIIEVDGSVVPYSLTPGQLTQVFRPGNVYGIVIEKRADGFFNIRNSAIKETEVRIFRTSKTGMFLDGSGSFGALDVLDVEFGVCLSAKAIINCAGAENETSVFTIDGQWGVEVDGVIASGDLTTQEMIDFLRSQGLEVVIVEDPAPDILADDTLLI